jgi:signal transduction histidine kinase
LVWGRFSDRLDGKSTPDNYEFRIIRKDGSILWVEVHACLIKYQCKPAILVAIIDVTERKQAEQTMEQQTKVLASKNAEMEQFIYTVSHDLRSPLVTIDGFAGLLIKDLLKGHADKVKMDVQMIENGIRMMDHLLNDTLELSRIGRIVNPPEAVPFADLVSEALSQASEKIWSRSMDLSVGEKMPTVMVDRMRIVEVLVNLIENSIKYIGDQPTPKIEIGFRQEDKAFFIKDNGIGIDSSQHGKVFELFYKMDSKSEGTGVGLAIVKRIIEVHGGRVWIESELGKGCIVCFTLPMDKNV